MPEMLLRTKLFFPPERPNLISRPKLIEQLQKGLQPGRKLVLISAPAGSGKTTLLSQFISRSGRAAAWLGLDKADNDPNRFWRYVIAAFQSVVAGAGESALELLDAPQPAPETTTPVRLINDIAQQEQDLLLVLDDYHVIHHPSIHESVSYFLDYLPDNLLLVIATRADPPWSLARYRARNQLVEIRARDLRFTHLETAEFLDKTMSLDLPVEDVIALETRTEGWVAGLQLAAVAIQSHVSPPERGRVSAFIQAFSGSSLFVAEYLLEEVLLRQGEEFRAFLLQTSLLERMSAELCDAVTGRQDGQAMLASLNKLNLFIIPLDLEGRWVRYHHLFADLLQARLEQELPADMITSLHKRAAAWYEESGYIIEAVRHLLAAQAYEKVAVLVEEEARSMMFSGQTNTLRGWLADLPAATLQAHARLQIYRLWIDLMQEKVSLSAHSLQEKENMLRALPPSPENERLRVELLAVLCRFVAFSGNSTRAILLAEEALELLPEEEKALRARAYSALAVAYWTEGQAEKAREAFDHCMRLALPAGYYSLAAHAAMMRAVSQIDYGQLHQAAATYQSIIDMGGPAGQEMFFPAGQGYIGLAGIYLEWNALETAEAHLQQGMDLCRRGGLAGLSFGHAIKARLLQARGDFQGAKAEINLLGETGVDPTGTSRQILLQVAMGDLDQASRLAKPWIALLERRGAGPQPPLLILEIIKVTLARLYLAQGELERVEQLLDEVHATAGPALRFGRLIEVHLLRALRYQQLNREYVTAEAIKSLERALELAGPQGYTLLFLEESPAVLPLLHAIRSRKGAKPELRQYAQQLIEDSRTVGKQATPIGPSETASLVEPLTPREMEVLQLVATGDTNQAIAETLFISVRTVKKHITNVLGKLGVSNRTQAVARARELGLITPD